MKKYILCKKVWACKDGGFTLMEILVAVLILTILITMAVPMYERTVEKSRLAEVSTLLKRISESKLRTMDSQNITNYYTSAFGMDELDITVPSSDDFYYGLYPESYSNAVCARRLRGDNAGTVFLYLGEAAPDYCYTGGKGTAICAEYLSSGRRLFCQNASGKSTCESYGLDSYTTGSCQ